MILLVRYHEDVVKVFVKSGIVYHTKLGIESFETIQFNNRINSIF